MAKNSSASMYVCNNCGHQAARWMGRCPTCNKFSTFEERASEAAQDAANRAGLKASKAVVPTKKARSLSSLSAAPLERTPTGISELDRVLSGGLVKGQMILFGGAPGSGKSTLSLELSHKLAAKGMKVLYTSGEESEHQIWLRASRMNIDDENIRLVNETNLEVLLGHIAEEKPDFLVVDSLQTLASNEVTGGVGSIAQGKEAAHVLQRIAKQTGVIMVLINQILKSGDFSGSEAVQHIVDTTLFFESDNDTPLRFLRVNKNRFGDTSEIGVFQHTETGLESVSDPSGIFLDHDFGTVEGSSRSFISEGYRQIPVEVQALVSPSKLPTPRKQFNGINYNRGQIVAAILDKFCKTKLFENDLFISTVSGLKVTDPQADLAVAMAILSSKKEVPVSTQFIFVGELNLTGQVRGSNHMIENKIKEAERLGADKLVLAQTVFKNLPKKKRGIELVPISSVTDLTKFL